MPADFPIGAVLGFGGDAIAVAVREQLVSQGWLLCDGSLFAVSDYPGLAALIGSRYGGDGTTTFAVPDLRGLFVRGTDHGRGVDPDSRRAVGSVQAYGTGLPRQPFAL